MTIPRFVRAAILFLVLGFWSTAAGFAADHPAPHDPEGVLRGLNIASFTGTSQDSIQAVATDSSGNIFVAGTTSAAQFPVKNAAQPAFGEATILRTTDLGATWTRVGLPPGAVTVVVPDPVSPSVLFAGGQNGIFKSTDSGQTWRTVYPSPGGYSVSFSMVIDPGNHLRLAAITPRTGAFLRSLDGGETWTPGGAPCNSSNCGGQLIVDPTGSGALAVDSMGIVISHDWGLTFQPLNPPGLGEATGLAFDPSNPGWIYMSKSRGAAPGTLSLSIDYGATWTPKTPPPSGFFITNLGVDPDQPSTLVAASADGLYYKSADGAVSWTLQKGPSGPQPGPNFSAETNDPFALVPHHCNPSGGIFAIGSAVGGTFSVAFSPDFGLTWATPQLTNITSVASGPGCTFYVTRTATSDAFVAKIVPEGGVAWTTYLGGSDRDAPIALALDPQGNVYVTGNTNSPDFPVSLPHIGPRGPNSVFLTKFSTDGRVQFSAMLGGESLNSVVALAVDASQNAYVAGITESMKFPITPGALVGSVDLGSYTGFLVKLTPDVTLAYGTYLGQSYTYPSAILVNANQEAIVAGTGPVPGFPPPVTGAVGFVMKLDRAESQVLSASYLPASPIVNGVRGLATDPQNNLMVYGQADPGTFQATPGAYSSPQPVSPCTREPLSIPEGGDAFVMKLRASDWQPVYGALFTSPCGIETGGIAIDRTGSAVLAMGSAGGLPLRSPLVGGPVCSYNSSAIAKLSADGSTLQFATYLNSCGVPSLAVSSDGSVYAGVSPAARSDPTAVLHLSTTNAAISIDQISNAFSGNASAVVGGALYTLAIPGFTPPVNNLGLAPAADLPTQLGGAQVKFNGVPANILATAPGQIIVAVPDDLTLPPEARQGTVEKGPSNAVELASVQLFYNGVASHTLWMPVSRLLPGLLTLDFPNLVYHADFADGNVRNQDGTPNDVNHPAAIGSTITLFATGVGATNLIVAPGSVAHSTGVSAIAPIYSTWQTSSPIGPSAVPEQVSSVPGFVSSIFQVQVQLPSSMQTLGGTDVGNGIQHVEVGLQLSVPFGRPPTPASNLVGLYVK